MPTLDRNILPTLVYYDLLDRPLTALEIYKYLLGSSEGVSFFDFKRNLEILATSDVIEQKNGLYFLPNRSNLITTREKRLKLAQLKWKKLKKSAKILALVPFLKLAAVTGSLTFYNTHENSDFDLLIVAQKGRLWTTRAILTALTWLFGIKRNDQDIRDRICLNCYLTAEALEIKQEVKPHDIHSAQEYGRLTPILETQANLYKTFIKDNSWLKNFLSSYPWPSEQTAKNISRAGIFNTIRAVIEWLLIGQMGNWLENKLSERQKGRINHKNKMELNDQIYVSDQCLMFHPHSKSFSLLQEFNQRIEKMTGKSVFLHPNVFNTNQNRKTVAA